MTTNPRPRRRQRRRHHIVALLLVAVVALTGASTATSGDEPSAPATTTSTSGDDQGIIPRPNSGRAPTEAGDRGGALQLGLLALMVAAVGLIVLLVVRESRRVRS